jgi:hypothetical protein
MIVTTNWISKLNLYKRSINDGTYSHLNHTDKDKTVHTQKSPLEWLL